MVIDPKPLAALFGVVLRKTPMTTYQAEAIAFSTLLARCLILLEESYATILQVLGGEGNVPS